VAMAGNCSKQRAYRVGMDPEHPKVSRIEIVKR
jgi:hypothetical protein